MEQTESPPVEGDVAPVEAAVEAEAVAVMRDLAGRRQVGFGAPRVAIVRGGESGARDAGSSSTTEGRPGARARRDAGNPG